MGETVVDFNIIPNNNFTQFQDFQLDNSSLDFLDTIDLALWATLILPILTYWVAALYFELMGSFKSLNKYKVVQDQELYSYERKNLVSKTHCIVMVLVQNIIQLVVVYIGYEDPPIDGDTSLMKHVISLLIAVFVMDTWQYFVHRLMHEYKFLYRNIHSVHHQLLAPYAYGALYNHPIEALLLDTLGGYLALVISGMGPWVAAIMFSVSTFKTVCDHSNFMAPINPTYNLFANNSAYHDVHHQRQGTKVNYSQPYLTLWDKLLGSYVNPATFREELERTQPKGVLNKDL